jgi:hypothetical protein
MLALSLVLPAALAAQGVTTGAFAGKVVDIDGNPVMGAAITIVHEPTGTEYKTLTRADGRYNVPAVKVGGPYTVTASYEGFKTETTGDLVVKLGETKEVNFTMQLATVDAGEVVVTSSDSVINPYRTGASQNVAQDAIESLPTISRSLSDFTRLSPQIVSSDETDGAFNVGGRSSRYNNVQVDGAQSNDLFGLGGTGTPGGQSEATVISLEAVQEFQIVMAPYDVRQGMFTGGGVNIITKSGNNDFFGSLFYEFRNENFVGKGPDDYEFGEFSEGTYGGSFGGPLIQNKLFFFANAELAKRKIPEDKYIDGSGAGHDWGRQAEADRFISILSDLGYDAGGYGEVVNERNKLNVFGRLDWNISEKNRLIFRHSYLDSDFENLSRSSSSSFRFGNGGITYITESHSSVLQLNSTLGNNIFNELIVNYQTIRDNPTYMGEAFPQIIVSIGGGSFYAGSEEYRHKNELNQDLIEITDHLTIFKGNHTFVFGTHNEFFKFYNVYVQRAFGKYEFKSLDDFEAGNVYRYDRYYSLTGDPNAPAEFNVFQTGLFAMDEWNVMPNLKLTIGIRADIPLMPDDPSPNSLVEEKFGIPTNQNAGGNILWSPRVGFNYAPSRETQIRGGIGIFSGRTPYVWISNQYSNNGTDLARYRVYYPDFFVTDPNNQPENPSPYAVGDINLIDESYKFPQVLKTNIAIDQKLPGGFTATLEFVYSKSLNEILYQNINIQQVGVSPIDGRPLFGEPSTSGSARYGTPDYVHDEFQNVIYLSNTKKGYQYTFSLQVQKEWGRGNMINAAYTYGVAKDLFGGTSSRAVSNWGYNITAGNPNDPELAYSTHDPGHRIMFAITKKFDFVKKAPTYFSVFYNGRSGRRYPTRYYNDFNGDSRQNDSIWVPASADQIILTKGTWDDLNRYIQDDPALEKYRGQILPRNASRDKWYNGLDFRISQVIPIPGLQGHRLELYVNVKNLLNLFNKEWGVYRYIGYDDTPLTFVGYDAATGKPKFEFWGKAEDRDARYNINQLLSRWQAKFGFMYRF